MKSSTVVWMLLLAGILSVGAGPVYAGPDTEPALDESLDGFGDTGSDDAFFESGTPVPLDKPRETAESKVQTKGFLKEELAYMPENSDPGISKVKTTINASLEFPLSGAVRFKAGGQAYYDAAYDLSTRDRYDHMDPGSLEWDAELKDTWLGITLPAGWYVRSGKQIAAWGESEVFRLNDRVNPRDIREPGMTELEDARLPVFSTLADYHAGPYRITVVAVHEENRDVKAPERSDFDYFASVRGPGVSITGESVPDVSLLESDIFLRWTRFFNGGDISLYAASAHEQEPYLAFSHMQDGIVYLTPEYGKTPSAGISANGVRGSFLFRAEGIWLHDVPVQRKDMVEQLMANPGTEPIAFENRDTYKLMAGVDYSGFSDITLTLEGYHEAITGYADRFSRDKHTGAIYGSYRQEILHSTLSITLNTLFILRSKDSLTKAMLSYDLMDAVTLEGGVMIYHMDDTASPYYPLRKKDSVFSAIRFSF